MRRLLLFILLLFPLVCTHAALPNDEPLPIDQAFQFAATAKDYQTALLMWKIAPGYYIYRERIKVVPTAQSRAAIGQPLFPRGIKKSFPSIGSFDVYQNHVAIPIPIIQSNQQAITLNVTYQGCANSGYCYPPATKQVTINLTGQYGIPISGKTLTTDITRRNQVNALLKQDRAARLLAQHNLWAILLGFFGFGLLISFTPCVLPMIPILSSIILGHKKMTHWHAFCLSLSYVFGMAITYAAAGVLFGFLGSTVQSIMQQPWLIASIAILFSAMALSLFGLYNIQIPEKIRSKFAHLSEHQKHGTYAGVFLMGVFSTLVLSPCVTPPLVGVLSYISQTGNAALGGGALFIMGIGMGIPLLIIGATSAKWLPKTGAWMNTVKNIMGILLLAVAILMMSRIIPEVITMLLWAALSIGTGIYLDALSSVKTSWQTVKKGIGLLFFIYGIILIIGAAMGYTDPLNPLPLNQQNVRIQHDFTPIKTVADVYRELAKPQNRAKPALLDFYADWCISCKVIDNTVFTNPTVQKALANYILLRANITANDKQDKALMQHFKVVAPPTILLFNDAHQELKSSRIVGEISVANFIKQLNNAKQ